MIKKVGKPFSLENINRNTEHIEKMVQINKKVIDQAEISINTDRACRICESENLEKFVTMGGKFDYYRCNGCGSIVLIDLPDTRKIYESNPETPVEHYINEELFNKRIKMIAEPKINFIIDVLNSDVSNKKWLDIGCGTGEILMAAKAQGFDAYGIESDEREVTFGNVKGLNIKQAFVSPETKDKEIIKLIKEADIVSLYNLLEHIENPKRFMEFVKENMKLGAKLVIEVPHTPSLAEFVNLAFPMITYRHLTAPQHLQIFSEEGMKKILGEDFPLIATWGFGQGFTDILNAAAITSKTYDSEILKQLRNISNEVQKAIDENGYSDAVIYVAVKVAE